MRWLCGPWAVFGHWRTYPTGNDEDYKSFRNFYFPYKISYILTKKSNPSFVHFSSPLIEHQYILLCLLMHTKWWIAPKPIASGVKQTPIWPITASQLSLCPFWTTTFTISHVGFTQETFYPYSSALSSGHSPILIFYPKGYMYFCLVLKWSRNDFKVHKSKRFIGLKVYHVCVKMVDSLEWWCLVAYVR